MIGILYTTWSAETFERKRKVMNIYEKVKECCKEKGISIRALEKEVGLGNGAISHWRNNNPTLQNLVKVADVLGKSVEDFLDSE